MISRPDLSDEQAAAYDRIVAFVRAKHVEKPWIVVEGAAGVGKTRLLAAVANRFPSAKMMCPFGKAASNLARKTGLKVTTVHSAIYAFAGKSSEGELLFDPKIEDRAWQGRIALVDEHSTLAEPLGRDLANTGCRIVACGDPGQLPPVNGRQFFTSADVTLQTIHRQALNSPIIRQAHAVRNGGTYEADGPDFRVQSLCSEADVLESDIILTWTNHTRRQLNHLKRAYMGRIGIPPRAGEPVMCLRNDHRAGVLNGSISELLEDYTPGQGFVRIRNERGERIRLHGAWIEDFDEPIEDTDEGERAHPFALAFAATVHKAQGSEWDNVLIVDEMPWDREERARWLYTGITRASQKVLVKVQ